VLRSINTSYISRLVLTSPSFLLFASTLIVLLFIDLCYEVSIRASSTHSSPWGGTLSLSKCSRRVSRIILRVALPAPSVRHPIRSTRHLLHFDPDICFLLTCVMRVSIRASSTHSSPWGGTLSLSKCSRRVNSVILRVALPAPSARHTIQPINLHQKVGLRL